MQNVKVFNFNDYQVRSMIINQAPWFVGKDVAEVLGYSNTRKAILDHVDPEDKTDGVTIRDAMGREQKPTFINESGLYSLILSSKLPQAKEFKRWVTSEVLPQIRVYGHYTNKTPRDFNYSDYNNTLKYIAQIIPGVQNKAEFINTLLSPYGVVLEVGGINTPTTAETLKNSLKESVSEYINAHTLQHITTAPAFLIYSDYEQWCKNNNLSPRPRNSFTYHLTKLYHVTSYVRAYDGNNKRFYKI